MTASSNSTKKKKSSGQGFKDVDDVQESFRNLDYISDRTLATTLFLATKLEKPLFLEGEAGVGKTELAKVLASAMDTELIRLQCYEGLDANSALYEWNYAKQLLHIKMEEGRDSDAKQIERDIFSEQYLIERPLLRALLRSKEKPVVLLIDEIDRSDEEFEAFLLEILSDYQITIPEMGTVQAASRPLVVLTSNRTREIHDAPQAPLPVSVGRLSLLRERSGDHHDQGARGQRSAGGTDFALHDPGETNGFLQAPRRGRIPRLGAGAPRAAPQ